MPGSFRSLVRRWLGFEDTAEIAPEAAASVTIEQSTGGVDEVKVDLGPDERGAGLLERWSEATSSGEPTVAPPANAPLPELPEVTIKASRAAIPFDRTIPRVDPEPAPGREVTVTEALKTSPFPWALVLAAIAMVVLAIALALIR
jgi:hypothetical protein